MTVLTSGAKPCLGCGTEGGMDDARTPGVPARKRGICNACYQAARRRLEHTLYPACGRRPIARTLSVGTMAVPEWKPAPWGHVPFSAEPEPLPVRWLTLVPTSFYDAAD